MLTAMHRGCTGRLFYRFSGLCARAVATKGRDDLDVSGGRCIILRSSQHHLDAPFRRSCRPEFDLETLLAAEPSRRSLEAFFDALAALRRDAAHLVQMFELRAVAARPTYSAAGSAASRGAKDDQDAAAVRVAASQPQSRTSIQVDLDGLPLALPIMSAGGVISASDSRNLRTRLLDMRTLIFCRAPPSPTKVTSAKCQSRRLARKRGICPVIPHTARLQPDRPAFLPERSTVIQSAGAHRAGRRQTSSASSASPFVARRSDDAQLTAYLRASGGLLETLRPHLDPNPSTRPRTNLGEASRVFEPSFSEVLRR